MSKIRNIQAALQYYEFNAHDNQFTLDVECDQLETSLDDF